MTTITKKDITSLRKNQKRRLQGRFFELELKIKSLQAQQKSIWKKIEELDRQIDGI